MFKNAILTSALSAALIVGAGSFAQASSLELPEFAPVPVSRDAALADVAAAAIPHFPVVKISVTPEVIPLERRNVRLVGTRFLPPVDAALALKVPGSESNGLMASIEMASSWVLETASAGIFGEAVAADQTVAAVETQ